jgi:hypothetical protein
MGVLRSLRKQRKLRRISRALGAPFDGSRLIDELVFVKPSKKEKALQNLCDLCESDPRLRQTMEAHGANREVLRELYKLLIANGAGQWVGGHFVAASALAYGFPLLFVLQNADTLPWSRICVLLIEYFERNDTGPVPSELRGPADPNDPLNALWEVEQRLKREE